MNPQTFEEAVRLIASEIAELVIRKQRDYGHGNILAFGELGVVVRVSDKAERLKHLYKTGDAPRNEAVEDTWDDLAGYSLIGKMLRRGWFELPLGIHPCPKCGMEMQSTGTYVGESSNIGPIGQQFCCVRCGTIIGITQDGEIHRSPIDEYRQLLVDESDSCLIGSLEEDPDVPDPRLESRLQESGDREVTLFKE